jgi:hypothetical protein
MVEMVCAENNTSYFNYDVVPLPLSGDGFAPFQAIAEMTAGQLAIC